MIAYQLNIKMFAALCLLSIWLTADANICKPAKEDLDYKLTSQDFQCSENTAVMWKLGEHTIDCVYTRQYCTNISPICFRATFSVTNKITCKTSFLIPNVTGLDMEANLSLTMRTDKSDFKEQNLITCLLTVIEKLRDITCTHEFREDGLHIMCNTVRRYRAINRAMGLKLNSENAFVTENKAACKWLEIPACEHFISLNLIGIGNHSIKAIIYPNISHYKIIEIYGDSKILDTIRVEFPQIEFDEGCKDGETNKSCILRRLDNSALKTSIRCFVNGELKNKTDARSLTISFNADSKTEINCSANNSFGWISKLPTMYFNNIQNQTSSNNYKISTIILIVIVIVIALSLVYSYRVWFQTLYRTLNGYNIPTPQ